MPPGRPPPRESPTWGPPRGHPLRCLFAVLQKLIAKQTAPVRGTTEASPVPRPFPPVPPGRDQRPVWPPRWQRVLPGPCQLCRREEAGRDAHRIRNEPGRRLAVPGGAGGGWRSPGCGRGPAGGGGCGGESCGGESAGGPRGPRGLAPGHRRCPVGAGRGTCPWRWEGAELTAALGRAGSPVRAWMQPKLRPSGGDKSSPSGRLRFARFPRMARPCRVGAGGRGPAVPQFLHVGRCCKKRGG